MLWPIDKVDGQPFKLSRCRERLLNTDPNSLNEWVGLRFLGSGLYGRVFALGEKHVLKLNPTGDEGYEAFVSIALRNPNPHFPRFRYAGAWGDIDAYVLERLEPCEDMSAVDAIDEALCRKKPNPKVNYQAEWGPHFWPAIELLIAAMNDHNRLYDDIGYSNVMQRLDGTIVITDPFC